MLWEKRYDFVNWFSRIIGYMFKDKIVSLSILCEING